MRPLVIKGNSEGEKEAQNGKKDEKGIEEKRGNRWGE